jgi:uncharacterized protein (UPF0248 family)
MRTTHALLLKYFLDAQYMEIISETGTATIPYHRIVQIRYHDQIIWDYGNR